MVQNGGRGIALIPYERRRWFAALHHTALFYLLQRLHIHYDGAYQKRVLITSSTEEGTDIYLKHLVRAVELWTIRVETDGQGGKEAGEGDAAEEEEKEGLRKGPNRLREFPPLT